MIGVPITRSVTTVDKLSVEAKINESVVSTNVVDNAVGVPEVKRKWFVGIVRRNTEKVSSERLQQIGVKSFVATQKEQRVWRNGRKKTIERVVITTIVFVYATEQERMETMRAGIINRYMVDHSSKVNQYGRHSIAVVSDREIESLQFMLYHSNNPVDFTNDPILVGENVRVVRGPLKGFEGKVVELNSSLHVYVSLNFLGSAITRISLDDIQREKEFKT